MRDIVLFTGGCRSGKSARALTFGETVAGPRGFVATCPRLDEEMDDRIARHRQEREAGGWQAFECDIELAKTLEELAHLPLVLVDCLSLWINNLLFAAGDSPLGEDAVSTACREVITAVAAQEGLLLMVTNEVGLGIVPDNPLARRYRDLLGRCNQTFASAAKRVELLVAGIPLTIKDDLREKELP